MKRSSRFARILSLMLVAAALTICPAGYAQTKKTAGGTTRQSINSALTDESNPAPTVLIRMQIPQVLNRDIEIFGYEQQSALAADPFGGGGGGGTPKVIAGPVTVTKRIDEYTPLFNQVHLDTQHFTEVNLQWYRIDPSGRTGELFFSMKLNDAVISAIHRNLPNQRDPAFAQLGEVETVSFVCRSIEMTVPNTPR